jgi:hypothetical protein
VLVVGQHLAGSQRGNVLGRHDEADDRELFATTIQHRGETAARRQVARLGEGLVDRHFEARAERRQATTDDEEPRASHSSRRRQREHATAHRLAHAVELERDVECQARFHAGDAVDPRERLGHLVGRARHVHEDVGKRRCRVESGARSLQRAERTEGREQYRHAAADHEGDARDLPAQRLHIAPQLALKAFHQSMSRGERRSRLGSEATIRPREKRRIRSAMPAIAAL